jgi:hypothetical protein
MAKRPASNSLRVRTNLRAGLAWDDLDDKAAEWWNQLTSAVSGAVSNLTGGSGSSQTTSS